MNPHTFAQRDCANHIMKDGSCLGITVECLRDPEKPIRAKPLERCLLAGKTLRPCRYFEKVVLPLADQPSSKDEPDLQRQRLEARQKYLAAREMEVSEKLTLRTCPDYRPRCIGSFVVRISLRVSFRGRRIFAEM